MSRPRIPIDGYGEITFIQRCKGKVDPRTLFRDWDGQTRLVQGTAPLKSAAEVALKKKLPQRNAFRPVDNHPDARPCLRNGEPRRDLILNSAAPRRSYR